MTKQKLTKTREIPKWLRVLVPSVLIIVWVALAGIGGPYFGKISEVASNDQSTFLPASAESTKVNEQIGKFRDESAIPAIIVFTIENGELSEKQTTTIEDASQNLKKVEGVKGDISPPIISEDKKAALVVANVDSDAEFKEVIQQFRTTLDNQKIEIDYKITGPVGFLNDLTKAFAGIDGILLLVALAVVFIILLIVYRSPILPFLVLINAIAALAASIFVVWHLADAGLVQINGQVQGILFILVIGAATDYSLLFISRYREELENYQQTWQSILAALKGSFEPVLAAGGTVIVGLLCLLLSDLNSNKALGPVGAIGIAMAIISALSFLPAMLLAVGRKVFWPRIPKYEPANTASEIKRHGMWAKIAKFVSWRPRTIWIVSSVVLIAASMGVMGIKANGVPQSEIVLGTSEARDGQKLLDAHFPAGSGTPATIIASSDKLTQLTQAFDADKGVDSVEVIALESPSDSMPLGEKAKEIRQTIYDEVETSLIDKKAEIRTEIEKQTAGAPSQITDMAYDKAIANIPTANELTDEAYPFTDSSPKIIDDKVLMQVTLLDNADSTAAQDTIVRLRTQAKAIDDNTIVGGTTAVQYDTNQASIRDREVVIPVVLVVITLILMALLRSILAPILLLLTTIASFGATLGISSWLFNDILHFPGADPSVVLYAFIFLVALGIDYNIFLMTRVREESLKIGTRKGVVKGLIVTGGVITSAGVVLAATFAALAVIPILFLVQLAFIVAFGVLLDTTLVRSLLVPALVYDIGKNSWWPSRRHKN